MKNFLKLASGLPVMPLVTALHTQELWDKNTLRTTHPGTPHTEVNDIWLRFNDLKDISKVADEHESICYDAWFRLPQALPLIFDLMRVTNGFRLGRVIITRLKPGGKIAPHEDGGSHAAYYQRFHIMLQNNPGSIFYCDNEEVFMAPGDVWWFDNSKTHWVTNNSTDDRITMIVDIRVDPSS